MYVFLPNSMLLLQNLNLIKLKRIVTGSLYIMWLIAIHHRGHFSLQMTFFRSLVLPYLSDDVFHL